MLSFFCRFIVFFGIFSSLLPASKLFGDDFFETLVILSAILLPVKSPVPSAVLLIALFDAVFIASVVDYVALSRSFLLYLLLKFLPIFLAKDKNP